jgi:phosphatidylglycerophosphate synthase
MEGDPRELERWSRAHALMMLTGLAAGVLLRRPWPLALCGVSSFAGLWIAMYRGSGLSPGSALANGVTAFRLALTLGVLLAPPATTGTVLALAVMAILLLDGLDGWVARRAAKTSDFGAHFDMETDAFLVLIVGFELWRRGHAGLWILGPGLLRYAYVICLALVPPRRGEMPRSRFGRYVFAFLVVSFSVALAFPGTVGSASALLGSAFAGWSFARSFYWSYARPTDLSVRG